MYVCVLYTCSCSVFVCTWEGRGQPQMLLFRLHLKDKVFSSSFETRSFIGLELTKKSKLSGITRLQ